MSQALLFGADFHQPHGRGQQMFGDAPDFAFITRDYLLHQLFAFFTDVFYQVVKRGLARLGTGENQMFFNADKVHNRDGQILIGR